MKILSLKALNINSLKGKTEINFSELTKESSLFAITGPTGSGKSTLLDIISCALYGRTARLRNPNDLMSRHSGEAYCEVEFEIKGKRYRSSWAQKRARNRHDGKFQTARMELVDLEENRVLALKSKEVPKKIEALSGLDFERFRQSMMLAQGGFDAFLKADEKERSILLEKITGTQIYADISIAVFERHRNLQQEMDSDLKILDSIELLDESLVKEKEANLASNIEENKKTGVELEELNKALQWMQKLSELILENKKHEQDFIEISKRKEEHKNSFEKLSLANRALNVSATFTSYTQLQETLQAEKISLLKLSQEIQTLGKEREEKEQEYAALKKEFEDESSKFNIQRKKLKLAREIQTEEKQSQERIRQLQSLVKSKKENLALTTQTLNASNEKYNQIVKKLEATNSSLKKSAKDEKLLTTLGIIAQTIAHFKEEEKTLLMHKQELQVLDKTLLSMQTKQTLMQEQVSQRSLTFKAQELEYKKLIELSLNDARTEERLNKSLQEIATQLRRVESYTTLTQKKEKETKEHEKSLSEEQSLLQERNMLQAHIEDKKKYIETLREKKEQEQLLKKYEEDRKKLVEGEACALCGSTTHPYADGLNELHIDETERMISSQTQELQTKERSLKELESRLITTQAKVERSKVELKSLAQEMKLLKTDESENELKKREENLKGELHELKLRRIKKDALLEQKEKAREAVQTEEKSLHELNFTMQKNIAQKEQLTATINSKQLRTEEYKESIKAYFQEFGLALDTQRVDSQYQELLTRKDRYSESLERLKALESELNRCELEKKESQTKAFAIDSEIQTALSDLKELELRLSQLTSKRIEILNVAELDTYEKEITLHYEKVQRREQLSKEQLNELFTKYEERSSYKKVLDEKIVEDEKRLQQLKIQLEALYRENDFKNEQEFQSASLTYDAREALLTLCNTIDTQFAQAQTLQLQSQNNLKKHQEIALNDRPIQELQILRALLEQKRNALQENIGSDKKELEINKENTHKHQERIQSLQKKKEAFKVWVKLNELIGSADGTKFKKFAQGITLDQLINLANQHLDILSSRYTLARNQEKLLDLEVIDSYQGNVLRPVSTLSGGESFIVSLALALGLSELASQKISIDSLFLDEGFGTLDGESLESALNALNLLQSGGKMVGVISHVEALKERIPLQIKIIPNGDGSSLVQI